MSLSDNTVSYGDGVFEHCPSLVSINLPSPPDSQQYPITRITRGLFVQAVKRIPLQNMIKEDGRSLLVIAAEISLKWKYMKLTFDENKPAVCNTDAVTGLPVFLLAAVGPNSDIESVYRLIKEQLPALRILHQNQPQQLEQPEFGHAKTYVTTIKKRFSTEPYVYQQFLEILHTYEKEPRGIRETLEQVSSLFADHPDLLKGFTYFLPDAAQEQAKDRLHVAAAEAEARQAATAAAAAANPQNIS